jgi:hypothetical protein
VQKKIKFHYLFVYQLNIFTKAIILVAAYQIHHLFIDSILNQSSILAKIVPSFIFLFFFWLDSKETKNQGSIEIFHLCTPWYGSQNKA